MKLTLFALVVILKVITVYSGGDLSPPSFDAEAVINDIQDQLDDIKNQIATAENDVAKTTAAAIEALETAINALEEIIANNTEDAADAAEILPQLKDLLDIIKSIPPPNETRRKRQWSNGACGQISASINLVTSQSSSCQIRLNRCQSILPRFTSGCGWLRNRLFGRTFGFLLGLLSPCFYRATACLSSVVNLGGCMSRSVNACYNIQSNAQTTYNIYCAPPPPPPTLPPPPPPPTSPPLDFSIFATMNSLYVNNVYVKTACLVEQQFSYQNAVSYLSSRGFSLFNVASPGLQPVFFQYLATTYADFNSGAIWVDGFRINGIWYSSQQIQLSGISWKSGYPTDAGDCLTVQKSSMFDPFGIVATPCGTGNWFFAEYVDPSLTTIEPTTTEPTTTEPITTEPTKQFG